MLCYKNLSGYLVLCDVYHPPMGWLRLLTKESMGTLSAC